MVCIALNGELDRTTVPILEEQISEATDANVMAIMLDLRELTLLDRSAMHLFLAARERAYAKGYSLILVGANPRIRRLFELTDTEFLLNDQDAAGVLDAFTRDQGRRTRKPSAARKDAGADA